MSDEFKLSGAEYYRDLTENSCWFTRPFGNIRATEYGRKDLHDRFPEGSEEYALGDKLVEAAVKVTKDHCPEAFDINEFARSFVRKYTTSLSKKDYSYRNGKEAWEYLSFGAITIDGETDWLFFIHLNGFFDGTEGDAESFVCRDARLLFTKEGFGSEERAKIELRPGGEGCVISYSPKEGEPETADTEGDLDGFKILFDRSFGHLLYLLPAGKAYVMPFLKVFG